MTVTQRARKASQRNTGEVATPPLVPASGQRSGSLLLEAIIAIGIFSIFLAGIGLSLLVGERSAVAAGDRVRAAFVAEQQLEGVRQMRNANYASVTAGIHGIVLNASGWTWSGSAVSINGYTGSVKVSQQSADWQQVTSQVMWDFGKARSGSVILTSYITNWRKIATVGNWAAMSRIANVSPSGSPDFQNVVINGVYAYVTGTQVSGGNGLYIYDVSNPANPVRVATSFNLGASAYGIAAAGNRLYLATDNPVKEVQVYDITNPATLSGGNLINGYDLPGSGKARSIAVYGSRVFVGTLNDPPNKQFYSIQMSETGPMVLGDSLGLSGSVLAIGLQDGYAYAATSYSIAELQVVDIFNPDRLTFAPGRGVDMPDVQAADAVALSGTSALVGRLNGSTIDELTLFNIGRAPVPNAPPGPWTLEIGGDLLSLATIFGSKYAFAAGSAGFAQLRVLDMIKFAQNQPPIVNTYDAKATVRGVFYDWQTDRLFGVTPGALMVFAPG